jgi:hypothetical protein
MVFYWYSTRDHLLGCVFDNIAITRSDQHGIAYINNFFASIFWLIDRLLTLLRGRGGTIQGLYCTFWRKYVMGILEEISLINVIHVNTSRDPKASIYQVRGGQSLIQRLVGKLKYLIVTSRDLSFVVRSWMA